MQAHPAQVVVELLKGGFLLQGQVENRHGDVRGRHPDGVAAELAAQLRQRLGGGRGGPGLGQHHVQRRGAAPARTLVEVVQQVLVVGVGVHRFHVAVLNAELITERLERRHDGVGGAARQGQNGVAVLHHAVVDAGHDVLDVALAGRGEDRLADARALQVLAETLAVAPFTGVVHQQRVLDAVLGVVDGRRIIRVNDLDVVAVGDDRVVFLVHGDGAGERAVHGIAAQQAGALLQVALAGLADHHGLQAQAVAGAGLLDQQAGQQAADTAETVQHHVGLARQIHLIVDRLAQLFADVVLDGQATAVLLVLHRQLADVQAAGAQIELGHFLQDREGIDHGKTALEQLGVLDLLDEAMGLEDLDHGIVDQGPAVHGGGHVLLAVETADHRDHGLCDFFAVFPASEVVFQFVHGCAPHRFGLAVMGARMIAPKPRRFQGT